MRRVIEAGLNANEPFSLIARKIGVATSTVSREVRRNRRRDGPSRKVDRDKNDCAMLKTCKQKHLCGAKGCGRLCRCCLKPCERYCPDHLPRTCERTAKAVFTSLGLSQSTAASMMLKAAIDTRSVPFSLEL